MKEVRHVLSTLRTVQENRANQAAGTDIGGDTANGGVDTGVDLPARRGAVELIGKIIGNSRSNRWSLDGGKGWSGRWREVGRSNSDGGCRSVSCRCGCGLTKRCWSSNKKKNS